MLKRILIAVNIFSLCLSLTTHSYSEAATQEIITKKTTDIYYNTIQYTLVKWALSRKNTGIYSQANRCMTKNPSSKATTDCSGFISWVMAKTKTELGLKNEWLENPIWTGIGFGSNGVVGGIKTTSAFRDATYKILNPKDLRPGDILVRLGPGVGYCTGEKKGKKGNNHVGIFLGFTKNGYQYIDCTSNGGGPAIQVKSPATKKPVNNGAQGSSSSGTWYCGVRLFDYTKLNMINKSGQKINSLDNYYLTTEEIANEIKKNKIDTDGKTVITEDYFKWRTYYKYGGKKKKLTVSLE